MPVDVYKVPSGCDRASMGAQKLLCRFRVVGVTGIEQAPLSRLELTKRRNGGQPAHAVTSARLVSREGIEPVYERQVV